MRKIPMPSISFEAFDAIDRAQGVANIFLIPVAVVQDGDLVAFVTPKTVAMPPNYFDDNEDVAVD